MSPVVRTVITPSDYGPVVSIVTWVLLAASILAASVKLILAHIAIGLKSDDWAILTSTVLSIAQSIAVSYQVSSGVGRHEASLPHAQLQRYQKAGYASELFYILTLTASKLSVVFFVYGLTFASSRRICAIAVGSFIAAWNFASFLAIAFQCNLPETWAALHGTCIHRASFWTSYGILNIITEFLLILLPSWVVWSVHIDWQQKAAIVICFAARLLVVAATITQLVFLFNPHVQNRNDMPYNSWLYVLLQEVVQSLSVVTACIPYVKSLLLGLESGMLQTGHVRLRKLSKTSS